MKTIRKHSTTSVITEVSGIFGNKQASKISNVTPFFEIPFSFVLWQFCSDFRWLGKMNYPIEPISKLTILKTVNQGIVSIEKK